MAESLESQWKKIMRNVYNGYYRLSYPALENQTRKICMRFANIVKDGKYTAMTGNAATGLAVGLYRDGELIAYSTMMESGMASPVTHVLRKEDKFRKGTTRYDGSVQEKTFTAGKSGANTPYFAWSRAVNALRKTKPTYKGYSFVVAHGAHYLKYSGYVDAVTELYADLSRAGAKMMTITLRNT